MRLFSNRGCGALITTAGDLLRWNDALRNARLGKLVSAKLAEPAKLNNGRTIGYGRGLMIDTIPGGPMLSHNGGAAGFSSWLGRFPEHELSIAVVCNFDPVSATALGGRVADLYLPPVDSKAAAKGPVAATGVDVSTREGLYLEDGTSEPLRLVVNAGKLAIAGAPPLVPLSADRFVPSRATLFFRSQDAYTLTFRSKDDFDITSMEGKVSHYRRPQPMQLTRADLQAYDGRYRSDELGQVFEVLPGARGVIVRFESAPERTLEALPIARDAFMMGQVYITFRRDGNGRITGFEYMNPVAQHIVFTRAGDRVSRAASAVASDMPKPEGLVGQYEMAPGRLVVVTLEDGQLYGQPTGNAKRPLVHVSGTTYGAGQANAPITLTFSIGADGRAESAVMRQGSAERTLRRVP